MLRKTLLTTVLVAFNSLPLSALAEDFLILDILPLHHGRTSAEAQAYFTDVEPIFARYGLTRSDQPLQVVDIVRGKIDAQVVNLWQTDDPQKAFNGIFSDEDYLQYVATRDKIFNLERATIMVTERKEG